MKEVQTLTGLVAKEICKAQGEFNWNALKDLYGNPSTAYAYHDYLKTAGKFLVGLRKQGYKIVKVK